MGVVDNLFDLSHFDQKLATGMAVQAKWSENGFRYCGKATVVKLRRASVLVKLLSVGGVDGRRLIGRMLELPRFCDQTRWSSRNCVQPIV